MILAGTATAVPARIPINISSQPDTIAPGGACTITVFALGGHTVPISGVDITLVSRTPGVTLSPATGKTDEFGRFESVMYANSVDYPMITIAGAATTSDNFTDGVRTDIPVQIPEWENNKSVALLSAIPVRGDAPLTVLFSAANSFDPDGTVITYTWTFGDGESGSGKRIVHTYQDPGAYTATVTVMDNRGGYSDPVSVIIRVTEKTSLSVSSGNLFVPAVLTGIVIVTGSIVLLRYKRGKGRRG